MDFRGIEIVCPVCRSDLRRQGADGALLGCVGCGRQFPVALGIPDLRVYPDPYIDMEGDRATGAVLVERCAGLDFPAAVDVYYAQATKVPASQARLFKRGLMAALARAEQSLDRWEREGGGGGRSSLLEIGCGTAPLLVVAARRFPRVVGIDVAFRWLVIAKHRLIDAGVDVPLICACADALPFPAGAFDRVVADSVLEHVEDQRATLAECHRVMAPAGSLFISTPNRFSLGPDPHVGVWAGGYLPKRWIDGYVRRQGGNPPQRWLLSSRHLQRLVTGAGFAPARIYLPDVPAAQRAQLGSGMNRLIDAYHAAKRLPGARQVLHAIGPLLHAVARTSTPLPS